MVVQPTAFEGDNPFLYKTGVRRGPSQLEGAALAAKLSEMSGSFADALACAPPAARSRLHAVVATLAELWGNGRKTASVISFSPDLHLRFQNPSGSAAAASAVSSKPSWQLYRRSVGGQWHCTNTPTDLPAMLYGESFKPPPPQPRAAKFAAPAYLPYSTAGFAGVLSANSFAEEDWEALYEELVEEHPPWDELVGAEVCVMAVLSMAAYTMVTRLKVCVMAEGSTAAGTMAVHS